MRFFILILPARGGGGRRDRKMPSKMLTFDQEKNPNQPIKERKGKRCLNKTTGFMLEKNVDISKHSSLMLQNSQHGQQQTAAWLGRTWTRRHPAHLAPSLPTGDKGLTPLQHNPLSGYTPHSPTPLCISRMKPRGLHVQGNHHSLKQA